VKAAVRAERRAANRLVVDTVQRAVLVLTVKVGGKVTATELSDAVVAGFTQICPVVAVLACVRSKRTDVVVNCAL
jgi:uncharacterized OsmC-like protein